VLRSDSVRESQTNVALDVLLDLSRPADVPLHRRLEQGLRDAIRQGRIEPGSALPPSRKLAADLGCSRWTVNEAYAQLTAEGYLEARTGSATRVRWSGTGVAVKEPAPTPSASLPRYDLAPGLPDLRAFPRRRWADALREQVTVIAVDELGYPSAAGSPRLRRLLASYLRRARGAVATADDLTVCSSVTDGVRRVCEVMRSAGIEAIACEEPGWTPLRQVARGAGLRVVPIRTDERGLVVDELAGDPAVRAVLITPAHQFPTGVVLAAERRAALLRWARAVDGVILEDDYDAEFRYDRRPVGTVQGMDPARVILFKSLSKMLSPALGIGWLVAPRRWTDALRHPGAGMPATLPPVLDQLAFATLLESGTYERHLRRCRQRYRVRRDALVRTLAGHLPGAPLSGIAAGLHLVVGLPSSTDPAAVVGAALTRSVRVAELGGYHATDQRVGHGLVVGYGNIADASVEEAVRLLAAAAREA
jgi:GntR family transcriptional regulator/MocR family aminotransferase